MRSAHERAFREHAGQQEREEYGEPAVDRKAGIEMDLVRRSRNGLADRADDEAEKLQREQGPGDRLQTGRVGGDERVALTNGLNDREQPFEDDVVQRDCGEAEHGDCAQAHDQPVCVWRRREFESAHDPLLVRHGNQQGEDRCTAQPVQDDEDS